MIVWPIWGAKVNRPDAVYRWIRSAIRTAATVLVLSYSALLVAPTYAQDKLPTDDDVNAVAKQLYCPVCENVPLDVCGTQACEQWRSMIRKHLAAGWDEERIKTYFAEQYGVRVLAQPPANDFNAVLWFTPVVVMAAGTIFALRFIYRIRMTDPTSLQNLRATIPDESYQVRLEHELEEWGSR